MTPNIVSFSQKYGIPVIDVRRLLFLASKAKMAKEKALSYNMTAYDNLANIAVKEFEKTANSLGFQVAWNALWPRLVLNNKEMDLPL
jgi:hypothetical protein